MVKSSMSSNLGCVSLPFLKYHLLIFITRSQIMLSLRNLTESHQSLTGHIRENIIVFKFLIYPIIKHKKITKQINYLSYTYQN